MKLVAGPLSLLMPGSRHCELTVKLQPRVKLFLPDTTCLTLDWGSHDVIAGGCTNGKSVGPQ